jgi:hypothetical protein
MLNSLYYSTSHYVIEDAHIKLGVPGYEVKLAQRQGDMPKQLSSKNKTNQWYTN